MPKNDYGSLLLPQTGATYYLEISRVYSIFVRDKPRFGDQVVTHGHDDDGARNTICKSGAPLR
jgi:hypothetical protein